MRGTCILVLFLVLVVLAGCSRRVAPSNNSASEVKTIVRDSIIEREVPRIVHVNVPGEKVVVKEYVQCDSLTNKVKPKTIKARSKSAFVDVTFQEDGSVTAEGGCDSLKAALIAKDRELFHYKQQMILNSKKSEKTIAIYKTRKVDIFCRGFTALVLAFLLLVLYNKLKPINFLSLWKR
jgi:hypothetical protein